MSLSPLTMTTTTLESLYFTRRNFLDIRIGLELGRCFGSGLSQPDCHYLLLLLDVAVETTCRHRDDRRYDGATVNTLDRRTVRMSCGHWMIACSLP